LRWFVAIQAETDRELTDVLGVLRTQDLETGEALAGPALLVDEFHGGGIERGG
jgi:hypothetical protein